MPTPSESDLLRVTPDLGEHPFNSWGAKARVIDHTVAELEHFGLLGEEPSKRQRIESELRGLDPSYFLATFVPETDFARFQLNVRWMVHLWLVDDSMDKAESATELEQTIAQLEREVLPPLLHGIPPKKEAPRLAFYMHDFHWKLRAYATHSHAFEHFQRTADHWLRQGSFPLARRRLLGSFPDPEEQISLRRWDSGADSCCALLEFCYEDLPQLIFDSPVAERLRALTCTHIALLNDLISYEQEVLSVDRNQTFHASSNLLFSFRDGQGMSEDKAFSRLLSILAGLHDEYWRLRDTLAAELTLDRQGRGPTGLAYLDALGHFMAGHLRWALHSERYRSKLSPFPFLQDREVNDFTRLHRLKAG